MGQRTKNWQRGRRSEPTLPPGGGKKSRVEETTTTTRLGFLSSHVVLRSETTPACSPFLFLGLTLAAAAAGGGGGQLTVAS